MAQESYQGSKEPYLEEEYAADYDQEGQQQEESFAGFVGIEASCHNCNKSFRLKLKLHKHLRQDCRDLPKAPTSDLVTQVQPKLSAAASSMTANTFSVEIVESSATDCTNIGKSLAFHGWNYAHVAIRLFPKTIDIEVCIDTGCGITLADRTWLLSLLPEVLICRMSKSLRVKGLGSAMHDTDQYVLTPMFISGIKGNGVNMLCRILREIHLVDNLKAHMLIGNDIVGPEGIVLDVSKSKAFIGSCNATANISCRQHGKQYTR